MYCNTVIELLANVALIHNTMHTWIPVVDANLNLEQTQRKLPSAVWNDAPAGDGVADSRLHSLPDVTDLNHYSATCSTNESYNEAASCELNTIKVELDHKTPFHTCCRY
jgi:hypothetical protein